MYRPERQRAIKEKHIRELLHGKGANPETSDKTVCRVNCPDRPRLIEIHKAIRAAYCHGAGGYAFHLMLDLERVLDGQKPLNWDFEERYRKVCRPRRADSTTGRAR